MIVTNIKKRYFIKSLIFFGTLRSKKLLKTIINRNISSLNFQEGHINNGKLFQVKNENFPYLEITKKINDIVNCIYVKNLTLLDFQKIKFYESIEYEIKKIDIKINNKKLISHYFSLIAKNKSKKKWLYEEWEVNFEEYACIAAKKWMNLFDEFKNKPEEAESYWPQILKNSSR